MHSLLYVRQFPIQILSPSHQLGVPVRGIVVVIVRIGMIDVEAGFEQLPGLLIQVQLVLPLVNRVLFLVRGA